MGQIRCFETSISNHQNTLRNMAEERRSHLNRAGSLKFFLSSLAKLQSSITKVTLKKALKYKTIAQGCTRFIQICELSQDSTRQNGDLKKFPRYGPTNIGGHGTKFILPGFVRPGIAAFYGRH